MESARYQREIKKTDHQSFKSENLNYSYIMWLLSFNSIFLASEKS